MYSASLASSSWKEFTRTWSATPNPWHCCNITSR
uniref:Uncharacterized protein n=1 Tax=Arundo donax TaxID=35708 RepID=A0A0A9F978_ARUDO